MATIRELHIDCDGFVLHGLQAGTEDGATVILLHGMKFTRNSTSCTLTRQLVCRLFWQLRMVMSKNGLKDAF